VKRVYSVAVVFAAVVAMAEEPKVSDWHHVDFWENCGEGFVTDSNPTYDPKAQPERWARFCAFTRTKDGKRIFAIRLWQEANRDEKRMLLPGDPALGQVVALVHLGTDTRLPCVWTENPPIKESGYAAELPEDFVRNPYADAFELVCR